MTEILREAPLTGGAVEIRGALEIVETDAGVLARRLPEWTRPQHQDPGMERMATSASGTRLAFRTAATVVELDLLTTVPVMDAQWRPGDPVPETDAGFADLCVDGVVVASEPAPVGTRQILPFIAGPGHEVPGRPGTVRFAGLAAGDKEIELWLPQWVRCELVALRADAAVEPPSPPRGPRWLHHGSSISQDNIADSPTTTWPALVARARGVELTNVGLSGNCLLDPFVARSLRDAEADLISLKLGINVTGRGSFNWRSFGPTVHGFLDTVREGHPDTPILVVSPIACPAVESTPTNDGIGALTLQTVRRELERIVDLRARTDPRIGYLDGLSLLGLDDVHLLHDGTHPSPAGDALIAERFARSAWEVYAALGVRSAG